MIKKLLMSGIFTFIMLLAPHALAADRTAGLSQLFDPSAYSGLAGTISGVLSVLGIVVGCAAVALVIILLIIRKKNTGKTGDGDK